MKGIYELWIMKSRFLIFRDNNACRKRWKINENEPAQEVAGSKSEREMESADISESFLFLKKPSL